MEDDSVQIDPATVKLTACQRRLLGVLVEKGMTTPEQYPLSLKSLTTGANQKSNRDPVTHYSEEQIEAEADTLREMQFVAVVHTSGGRTERYRHLLRHRLPLNEVQLAITAELMLRGQQQMGELRARVSRMQPLDSIDQLREELQQLVSKGVVLSSNSLEKRGVEIDHCWYQEPRQRQWGGALSEPAAEASHTSLPLQSGAQLEIEQLKRRVDRLETILIKELGVNLDDFSEEN